MENDIRKTPRLQGWDDEKIYFYDKKDKEYCIHDNEEVYGILLKMYITLFGINSKSKIATSIEKIETFLIDVLEEAFEQENKKTKCLEE